MSFKKINLAAKQKSKKGGRKFEEKTMISWALLAHACNTSHSEGRNQEDCGLKPTPGKQFKQLEASAWETEKTHHKKRLVVE
jgi:hypothetical protein